MGINSDFIDVTSLFLQINHRHFHCNHLKRYLNIGNFYIPRKILRLNVVTKKFQNFKGKFKNVTLPTNAVLSIQSVSSDIYGCLIFFFSLITSSTQFSIIVAGIPV